MMKESMMKYIRIYDAKTLIMVIALDIPLFRKENEIYIGTSYPTDSPIKTVAVADHYSKKAVSNGIMSLFKAFEWYYSNTVDDEV